MDQLLEAQLLERRERWYLAAKAPGHRLDGQQCSHTQKASWWSALFVSRGCVPNPKDGNCHPEWVDQTLSWAPPLEALPRVPVGGRAKQHAHVFVRPAAAAVRFFLPTRFQFWRVP